MRCDDVVPLGKTIYFIRSCGQFLFMKDMFVKEGDILYEAGMAHHYIEKINE